jgi:hypothetical protein
MRGLPKMTKTTRSRDQSSIVSTGYGFQPSSRFIVASKPSYAYVEAGCGRNMTFDLGKTTNFSTNTTQALITTCHPSKENTSKSSTTHVALRCTGSSTAG